MDKQRVLQAASLIPVLTTGIPRGVCLRCIQSVYFEKIFYLRCDESVNRLSMLAQEVFHVHDNLWMPEDSKVIIPCLFWAWTFCAAETNFSSMNLWAHLHGARQQHRSQEYMVVIEYYAVPCFFQHEAFHALNRDYECKIFKLFFEEVQSLPLDNISLENGGLPSPKWFNGGQRSKNNVFIGMSFAVLVAPLRLKDPWQIRIVEKGVFWPDFVTNQLARFGQNLQFSIGRPNIDGVFDIG